MQYTLWVRRYAPFDTFGGGFGGDRERSASTSEYDTARTIGRVTFGSAGVGKGVGGSSGTDHAFWPFDRVHADVGAEVTVQTRTITTLRFILHTTGSNPLVPLVSPDIDTYVHITVNMSKSQLTLKGEVKGDNFPNAEVFVTDSKGGAVLLSSFETDGGQTTGPIVRLWGGSADNLLSSFFKRISLNGDGSIRGVLVRCGSDLTPFDSGPKRRTPVDSGPKPRIPVASGR